MRKKLIAAALLIATTAGAGFAIIVHDPGLALQLKIAHGLSEKSRALQVGKQIAEAVKQLRAIEALTKDFKDYRAYLTIINGKWAQKIPGMTRLASLLNKNTPGDLRNLGWDLEIFNRVAHLRTKGQALNELRAVLDAEANRRSFAQMRDSIEEVYGEVPVVAEGAPVEAAYREIATVTAKVGDSTQRIEEKRERIEDLREEIESGELAPGDIERMQALVAAEQAELSMLQIDAVNNATRASVQSLGLAASEKRERVEAAIADRANRIEMSRSLRFGLSAWRDQPVH